MAEKDIRVTLYYRSPEARGFSIERVFDSVHRALPSDIHARKTYSPAHKMGIGALARNLIEAPRHAADVNHITSNDYYVAMRLDPRRTIITIHDLAQLHRLTGMKRAIFKRYWCDIPAKRSRFVTTVSEYSKQEIVELLGLEAPQVRVVYVPTDPLYRAAPRPFDERSPHILMIGTKWNKNVERQIAALEDISCRVTIVGPLSEPLKQAFGRHRVEYSNHMEVSDGVLRHLYEECDLVLFASLLEGFGMPIAEANAIGRPIIAGNRTSMPEVAGEAALLVDPEDIEDIRHGVRTVISSPAVRERLIERGFANARRFDVEAIASQYADLYREVADGALSRDRVVAKQSNVSLR